MDANDSQGRPEVLNETPTTTPPAPAMDDTPVPESQQPDDEMMVDANETNVEEDENEDLGSISLPLSKIKRIFKMDPEYYGSSQSAVFATGVATELFIQYLTEQASFLAKMDKRKKILYKDFSGAVAAQDSLHFLSDTVPKTVPLKNVLNDSEVPGNETSNIADTESNEPEPIPEPQEEPKPQRDIKNMLLNSGKSANQQPVKKATINDLVG